MRIRDALAAWLRSPLALGSLGFCLLAGPLAGFLAGFGALDGLLAGAALWVGFSLVSVQAPWGAKAIVSSRDAVTAAKMRQAVEQTEAARTRLSRLRVGEPAVAKALERFVLEAGSYCEACRSSDSRSPEADARILDAIGLVDLFLKESDEAATERRYGLPDADPFPDAAKRVSASLDSGSDLLREERIKLSGGLPPESLMEIREELK